MLLMNRRSMVRTLLASAVVGATALTATAAPPAPPVSITLCNREGHAWPARKGFTHTGGGNITVVQASPDSITITLSGVAVAGSHPLQNSVAQLAFDVCQDIDVSFDDPRVKRAKLTLEGRVTGLLRSEKKGLASISNANASVVCGDGDILSVSAPTHTVNNGVSLSINDQIACQSVSVFAGPLKIHQTLCLSATSPRCLLPCKASSSEFAPDPALDPLWISYWEPFHGAQKGEFGFQITVKVSDDTTAIVPMPAGKTTSVKVTSLPTVK